MTDGKRAFARRASRPAPGPRRVLNAEERQKLTVDAWGLVAFLQDTGLVRPDELEEALLLVAGLEGGEVDAADMALVLSSVISDKERVAMILGRAGAMDREKDSEGLQEEDEDSMPEPRLLH